MARKKGQPKNSSGKENAPPKPSRVRKASQKLAETNQRAKEQELVKKQALARKKDRATAKRKQAKENATATRRDDSEEMKQLKGIHRQSCPYPPLMHPIAELDRARAERDAAEEALAAVNAQLTAPVPADDAAGDNSIARPLNLSKVKVKQIRDLMGLKGIQNNDEWLRIRVRKPAFPPVLTTENFCRTPYATSCRLQGLTGHSTGKRKRLGN